MKKLSEELEKYSGKMREFLSASLIKDFSIILDKIKVAPGPSALIDLCCELILLVEGHEGPGTFFSFEEEDLAKDEFRKVLIRCVPNEYFKARVQIALNSYNKFNVFNGKMLQLKESLSLLGVSDQCSKIALTLTEGLEKVEDNENNLLLSVGAIDKEYCERIIFIDKENNSPFKDIDIPFRRFSQFLESDKRYKPCLDSLAVLLRKFESVPNLSPKQALDNLLIWAGKEVQRASDSELKGALGYFGLKILICLEIEVTKDKKVSPYFLQRIRYNLLGDKELKEGLAALKVFPPKNEEESLVFIRVEQHCCQYMLHSKMNEPKKSVSPSVPAGVSANACWPNNPGIF